MVDKFLKDFLNWSKELSLPMNVHELEASWEGLYAQKIESNEVELHEELRQSTLIPLLDENYTQMQAKLEIIVTEQVDTTLNNLEAEEFENATNLINAMSSNKILAMHAIAEFVTGLGYDFSQETGIEEKLDEKIVSLLARMREAKFVTFRLSLDSAFDRVKIDLETELRKNVDLSRPEALQSLEYNLQLAYLQLKEAINAAGLEINEMIQNVYNKRLAKLADACMNEVLELRTQKMMEEMQNCCDIILPMLHSGQLKLFDTEICHEAALHALGKVIGTTELPMKQTFTIIKLEQIYMMLNLPQDIVQVLVSKQFNADEFRNQAIQEWRTRSSIEERNFIVLCLTLFYSNTYMSFENYFASRLEEAKFREDQIYTAGNREFLRKILGHIWQNDAEFLLAVKAEQCIAAFCADKGILDWSVNDEIFDLAAQINESRQASQPDAQPVEEEKVEPPKSRAKKLLGFAKKQMSKFLNKDKGPVKINKFMLENLLATPSVHITIAISGWLSQKDEMDSAWSNLTNTKYHGQTYSLRWESSNTKKLMTSDLARVGASIVGLGLGPIIGLASVYNIVTNHPFKKSAKKAEHTGKALGELLRQRVFGKAVVSLVGFSLGARVIWACLKELASTGDYDIIHNVVLLGGAAPSSSAIWEPLVQVPTGRIINCHTKRDKVLAICYRSSQAELAAGSRPIVMGKMENYDVSEFIDGHMRYRERLQQVLKHINYYP